MFTGIIEALGEVLDVIPDEGTNLTFRLRASLAPELKIDQSLSHNGVCLTVTGVEGDTYTVTAVDETLKKTALRDLKVGSLVNLERCLAANGRFDGHIVQGHVDQTGVCTAIRDEQGSWLFDFEYESSTDNVTVEKGSICVNGVSLTVFNSGRNTFRVAIIPYTHAHTTFHRLAVGETVNLEFDVVGKYIRRMLEGRSAG
jgi:riboflavin synthase